MVLMIFANLAAVWAVPFAFRTARHALNNSAISADVFGYCSQVCHFFVESSPDW